MRRFLRRLVPRTRRGVLVLAAVAVVALTGFASLRRSTVTVAVPTAEVKTGEFVDVVELRGEIKAVRSVTLTAPTGPDGDLQIVWIAKNGSTVKQGDPVVRFDSTRLQRTLEQSQSDLKRSDADIRGASAQGRLQEEQVLTELMQARYDVERARLDVRKQEILSEIEAQKTRLRLSDAEQRLAEAEQKVRSGRTATAADVASRGQKRAKALFEVQRGQRSLASMVLTASRDGMVVILPNNRGRFFGSSAPEFKEGDRVWSGAALVELPDLSSIRVAARVDEADRGRLGVGQKATVRVDAVPDRDFTGALTEISPLAKVDFSTWPPPKNFDLALQLDQTDPRLRPGMSASARVGVTRLAGSILIPASAGFQRGGRTVAYVQRGKHFEEREVEVARRGRDVLAVARGLLAGEQVALKDPTAAVAGKRP